jgi:hypothetical protein
MNDYTLKSTGTSELNSFAIAGVEGIEPVNHQYSSPFAAT